MITTAYRPWTYTFSINTPGKAAVQAGVACSDPLVDERITCIITYSSTAQTWSLFCVKLGASIQSVGQTVVSDGCWHKNGKTKTKTWWLWPRDVEMENVYLTERSPGDGFSVAQKKAVFGRENTCRVAPHYPITTTILCFQGTQSYQLKLKPNWGSKLGQLVVCYLSWVLRDLIRMARWSETISWSHKLLLLELILLLICVTFPTS
jgi:hypothetical protein